MRSSQPGRASSALRSAMARKTAMMNAVELLIPEARGRSLAIEMSQPCSGAGKLRTMRRTTVAG